MKKVWFFITAAVLALTPSLAAAQESPLLNGEQHLYTVQLRSDKKSLVYARIVFTNPSADQELSTYKFSLPDGTKADNLTAQQILAKLKSTSQSCSKYETLEEWQARTNSYDTATYEQNKRCLESDEAVTVTHDDDYDYKNDISNANRYYNYSYYQQQYLRQNSEFEYSDLSTNKSDNSYEVELATPVKPKKQGSILLSFTTSDFINSGLAGRYEYDVGPCLPNA